MINNYDENKKIFNYIIKNKYRVKKDYDNPEILYIEYDDKIIKCKFLLLFTINKFEKYNKMLWSYENNFINKKTKTISKLIKSNINFYINYEDISSNDILKIINFILKNKNEIYYENNKITPIWIINDKILNFIQYFMIIDIIYF